MYESAWAYELRRRLMSRTGHQLFRYDCRSPLTAAGPLSDAALPRLRMMPHYAIDEGEPTTRQSPGASVGRGGRSRNFDVRACQ